jgi:hypothetical protein
MNIKEIDTEVLELAIVERLKFLDKMNKEYKKLEALLKSACFPMLEYKISDTEYIKWNSDTLRLCLVLDGIEKPMIEHKSYVRQNYYNYMNNFVTFLIDKANEQRNSSNLF